MRKSFIQKCHFDFTNYYDYLLFFSVRKQTHEEKYNVTISYEHLYAVFGLQNIMITYLGPFIKC